MFVLHSTSWGRWIIKIIFFLKNAMNKYIFPWKIYLNIFWKNVFPGIINRLVTCISVMHTLWNSPILLGIMSDRNRESNAKLILSYVGNSCLFMIVRLISLLGYELITYSFTTWVGLLFLKVKTFIAHHLIYRLSQYISFGLLAKCSDRQLWTW